MQALTAPPRPFHVRRLLVAVGLALVLILGGVVTAAGVRGANVHWLDRLRSELSVARADRGQRPLERLQALVDERIEGKSTETPVLFLALIATILGSAVLVVTVRRLLRHGQRYLGEHRAAQAALAQLNSELEDRVRERTRELVSAHGALEDELQARAVMEIELRQAQKLEAMGRLAAGVAHEINTPIQFVNDSLEFVRASINDLGGLIPKWQALAVATVGGSAAVADANATIERADEIEVDYLLEQLPKAMDRMTDGIGRVATIVRSLKDFAHPDTQAMSPVDMNHAVETTLTIARNEYKYLADAETDFGALPPVTCHPGDINQVILNLVVNAAHAIGDKVGDSGDRGLITIRTRAEADHVSIMVSDTGGGIPDHVREHIFEPFFTTKEPGRGTGQGLALAHRVVVEKHGGSISFDSEVGVGTTFNIRLPIDGRAPERRSGSSAIPRPQPNLESSP
ncbi:MAG: ATP-binding protein [Myxococcota bacterium]